MRFLLINPHWSYENSIYFGCREPHLPLEFAYSKALLESAGHDVQVIDAQMEALELAEVRERTVRYRPDFTVVTTAPSYLFWRCAPPELRCPKELIGEIGDVAATLVIVGPHASTTPRTTLEKLGADIAVLGECEEVLPRLASEGLHASSICHRQGSDFVVTGTTHAANMSTLPALKWDASTIAKHRHHHHRFDAPANAPGAEMETSRGCPYHCTFCAKDNFRNSFRRRPAETISQELDGLVAHGVEYVYFIDEIFLPFSDVLEAIGARKIKFGIQTRIDLWNEPMLELLGRAGCVSIEGGVESLTEAGRDALDKRCKLTTAEITSRLIFAKQHVPFVQANLLDSEHDNPAEVDAWRQTLQAHGVWANEPVPLFPYPGSPEYTRRWGPPDSEAWERAHEFYLNRFQHFSDIQEQAPARLVQLECSADRNESRI